MSAKVKRLAEAAAEAKAFIATLLDGNPNEIHDMLMNQGEDVEGRLGDALEPFFPKEEA